MRFLLLLSWLLTLHSLSIFLGTSNLSVYGICLDDQRSSLLQLNRNLSFSTPLRANVASKLASWDASIDCCQWGGVTCDEETGHVISLDLSSEFISSGIDNSSSLFELAYLQSLNLAYNAFNNVRIPSGFGRLLNLTHLNLSNSGFAGQIPIDFLQLTRLVSLDLSTLFTGGTSLKLENPDLRALVHNLTRLTTLRLDGVNISAQGPEWCQALSSALPNLQVLSLSNCHISGPLDCSLTGLTSLADIRLDLNSISSNIPECFANFMNLTSLRLTSCGLTGEFPQQIFRLPKLQSLDVSLNQNLSVSLPPELPNYGSLRSLVLSNTKFSGKLPDSIGNLRLLSNLQIVSSSLYGSIPSSLIKLAQLVSLDMSSNYLNGSIPSLGSLENLTQINLSNNRLAGPISSIQWDRLGKLVNLDLRNNSLSGRIPYSLFALPSLRKLQLSHNQLVGRLDESSNGYLAPLDTLDLSSNKLEGPVPKSIFGLQRLSILTLSSNNFNGTMQLEMIQNLKNLTSLDLSYNRLLVETSVDNSTSTSFSNYPRITTLKLASCNLTEFPEFLKTNKSTLTFLDLSNNRIRGVVPSWIWNISDRSLAYLNLSFNMLEHLQRPLPDLTSSSLATIDLHSNQLQGPIPTLSTPSAIYLDYSNNSFNSTIPVNISLCLNFTIFFSLSSNKLTGEIPASICNASYLQVLDLSDNNLSGRVPSCLAHLTSGALRVLNLGQNKLNASIPEQFPVGCGLRTLDLNGNRLEGQVPQTLGNCKMLEVLDLGDNEINDTFPIWLGNMTQLRVLVLRSNRFHGHIMENSACNDIFRVLQIIDLSSNNFTGALPVQCFRCWHGMMVDDKDGKSATLKFKFFDFNNQVYYQDTVNVTSKGLEVQLAKILTIYTSIDLSNNRFDGNIPPVIGNLTALRLLNLSHNAFTGEIPSSLGNLAQLESLDLSHNHLNGNIPVQLVGLNFLAIFNLSWNNLMGMIPSSNQFQTFSNDSYQGNEGLCGPPLSKKCQDSTIPQSLMSEAVFDWKFILTGLGFGGGAGLVIGPLMFWKKGRKWFDQHIDRVILMILPSAGLLCNMCDVERIEAEETIEMELTEMAGDFDDDDEEEKECRRRYCVFCSKLDISLTKVIHNPNCSCHTHNILSQSSL
ncbi:PREDICTED: receptor-like protein 12 [Nelumbo nucifera]|uniref:Receptor-like protein 12 n=1 Tax=Nelumbo nucifera TaxID=4432 RepID=A0A1U7ZXS9_NELNU|nr:PREDICTED: receptor-like protein 12 [Nelumbo nucifera]